MSAFSLPSGRALELHEPTFGEQLHLTAGDWENAEELLYAKLALIVPELSRDEVFNLKPKDGLALVAEVSRIWDGEPEPLKKKRSRNGSASPSTDSSLTETTSTLA